MFEVSKISKGSYTDSDTYTTSRYSQSKSEITDILKGKDSEFHLVCTVGGRSTQAAEQLSEMGFEKPINVMGGTNGWVAMGFPTEKGNKK